MKQPSIIQGQNGTYEIVKLIARGGRGNVYKALWTERDIFVCVKIFLPLFVDDLDSSRRLHQELSLVSRLQHPNVIAIYDAGDYEDGFYLVMEFFDEGSLYDRLKYGGISLEEALRVSSQIASALDYTHQQGVVHRDVKPQNILLSKSRAVLSDYGIAKILGDEIITTAGIGPGTAIYMSPEQGSGSSVDGRSDIYSLGVVVYEMLTGTVPHRGDNDLATIFLKLHEDPAPPTQINPRIPKTVDAVVLKALASTPDDRYQTATEFVMALSHAISQESPDLLAQPAPGTRVLSAAIGDLKISGPKALVAIAVLMLLACSVGLVIGFLLAGLMQFKVIS